MQLGIASCIAIGSLWVALTYTRAVPSSFLPTPSATLTELLRLIRGDLLTHIVISSGRVLIAITIAGSVGLVIGTLAGTFPVWGALVLPVNSAFRYIPPTAFIGITIIWFGIGESSKLALIIIGTIFYIIQMSADVMRTVPSIYLEVGRTLGATTGEVFRKILLPISLPELLAVLRINLGAAWTFLIVAELIAGQRGLGYLIATSQRFLNTPRLFALLIVVGLVGLLSDALLAGAIRWLSRWK